MKTKQEIKARMKMIEATVRPNQSLPPNIREPLNHIHSMLVATRLGELQWVINVKPKIKSLKPINPSNNP